LQEEEEVEQTGAFLWDDGDIFIGSFSSKQGVFFYRST